MSGSQIQMQGAGRRRIARIALGDLIHRAARRFGGKAAIIDRERRVSFIELNADSNRFAQYLLSTHATSGDRIGMLCNNSVEMVVAFTGIQKAGLVWVPINTGLAASAIDNIIEHAEIQYLVVDGELYAGPPSWRSSASESFAASCSIPRRTSLGPPRRSSTPT
jgi:long-chain acyl-CoA synthetase